MTGFGDRIGNSVELALNAQERELLLLPACLPIHLMKRIRIAPVQDGKPVFRFTLEELDELYSHVLAAVNTEPEGRIRRVLNRLLDRIQGLLDRREEVREEARLEETISSPRVVRMPQVDEGAALSAETPSDALEFLLGDSEPEKGGRPEALERFLYWLAAAVEEQPDTLWGGLSFLQFSQLVSSDWEARYGPVRLNADLVEEDLQGASILKHARVVLEAVQAAGGVRATRAGNLNRKFVQDMHEAMETSPLVTFGEKASSKVLNERDVPLLHIIRIIFEIDGLLRLRKGVFAPTRKAEKLLVKDEASSLYCHLFKAYFRRLNLAYLDGLPEVPSFQGSIAYAFYILGRIDRRWIKPGELAETVLLPGIRNEILLLATSDVPLWIVESRLIRPLHMFGLLECRPLSTREGRKTAAYQVRKTDLFNRFLSFHLDEF